MAFLDLPARAITKGVPGAALIHPVRLVPIGFLLAIVLGTIALSLPFATTTGARAPILTALFTAVSAVCVTGLVTVDTGTYWSGFGEAAILTMIQIGGLGTLVVTTLLLMAISDRLSLSSKLRVGAENRGLALGSTEDRVRIVLIFTLAVEATIAIALILWGWWWHALPIGRAAWEGVFHAVSAFNNAGFGLRANSLMDFAHDPVVLSLLSLAVILGGIGLPVVAEVWRGRRRANWSLHTRLTVAGTVALIAIGALATWAFDRGGALVGLGGPAAAMNAVVHSVMLRTAGFNAIDIAALSDAGIVTACAIMLIGGGSVGTAGGIKVTTVMVLLTVVAAELRARPDSVVLGRRLPGSVQREALTILVLAGSAIALGVLGILATTTLPLRDVLFEVTSAFATVGLSTGITAKLPPVAQIIIMLLMFVGRVGPITVGAALAMRARPVSIRYPEERPLVG